MTSGSSPDTNLVNSIAQILKEKKTIAVCLPVKASLDAVASGLALAFALEKIGKKAGVASSDLTDPAYNLVGQDEIQNTIVGDGDILVVSVPYKNGGVENVSYSIENEKLNIVIAPEAGRARIEPASVSFSYTGGKPDVIVTLYSQSLESLGDLYLKGKDQFTGVEIINIDRHLTNSNYGTINYVDTKSPSIAQMINEILRVMKVEMDHDIATNLYDALVDSTNNFTSYTVNAQAFRMAAFLLEKGASKRPVPGVNMHRPMSGVNMPGAMNSAPVPPMPSAQRAQQMNTVSQVPPFEQEGYDFDGTSESGEGGAFIPAPFAPVAPKVQSSHAPIPQAPVESVVPAQVHAMPNSEQPVQLKPQIFNKGMLGMNKG